MTIERETLMKEISKMILEAIVLPSYTIKQRLIMWYFFISFLMLFVINDDMNLLVVLLIVLNLGNSVRLIRSIDIPDDREEL